MLRLWDDRAKVPGIEDFTLRAGVSGDDCGASGREAVDGHVDE